MNMEFLAAKVRKHRENIGLDWNKHSSDPALPYYVRWEDPVECPGGVCRVSLTEEEYKYLERVYAAAMLGAARSQKKAKAARENGKKGGRPREVRPTGGQRSERKS